MQHSNNAGRFTQFARRVRYARALLLGSAAALAACDSPSTPSAQLDADDTGHLARVVALGLSDSSARESVRDAMRYSLVDGHAIVLQDFVASVNGAALRAAMSRAAGLTPAQVDELLADAPRLDFSMPRRAHRQSWQLNDPFVVVGDRQAGGDYAAYRPDGGIVRVASSAVSTLPAFFSFEPEARKAMRLRPQEAVPGDVIEEANDGKGSESLVLRYANGDSTVVDLSKEPSRSAVAFSGGADTTLLMGYRMNACDNDGCFTNLEIRIEIGMHNSAGTQIAYAEHRRGGIDPGEWVDINAPIFWLRLIEGQGGFFRSNLIEEDRNEPFGLNKDDYCGSVQFGTSGNNVTQHYPLQYPDCWMDGAVTSGALLLKWTPKQPPPPPPPSPTAEITFGPTSVKPNATCAWEGSGSGTTGPYTYEWYVNGSYIMSGQWLEYTNSGQSAFTVQLVVHDAVGGTGSTSRNVTVTSSAQVCLF